MNKQTYPRFVAKRREPGDWHDLFLAAGPSSDRIRVGSFFTTSGGVQWSIHDYLAGRITRGYETSKEARLALEASVCRSLLTLGEFFDVRLREIAKEVQEGGPRMMYKIEAYRSLTFCYVFSKWKYYNTPMYWGPWKTLRCAKRIRAKLNKERCSTVDQFGVTTDHGPAFRTVRIIEVHE